MKGKLKRFAVVAQRDNVLEPGKEIFKEIKGRWNERYFPSRQPITVELACGRGEYTVNLARQFPDRNFIVIDKKGDRLWKGSTWAVEEQLTNVGFLRTDILFVESFFEPAEVDELWITFPDPRPRKRDIKRRLTSPRYLEMYKRLVKPGGWVRFKTDNTPLFDFTLDVLRARTDVHSLVYTHDLYASDLRVECFDIKTRYEEMFAAKGETIKYLRFAFTSA